MKKEELIEMLNALPDGTDLVFYLMSDDKGEREDSDREDERLIFEGEICTSGLESEEPYLDLGLVRASAFPNHNCLVCGSKKTRKDYDNPDSMRCCEKCGSEWNIENEITFNATDEGL